MRQVRFASTFAAVLAALAVTAESANVDIGSATVLIGSNTASATVLNGPTGGRVDQNGDIFVSDQGNGKIKRIASGTSVAVDALTASSIQDIAFSADFSTLYMANFATEALTSVATNDLAGTQTTVATGLGRPGSVEVMHSTGKLFGGAADDFVWRVTPGGSPVVASNIYSTPGGFCATVNQQTDRIIGAATRTGFAYLHIFDENGANSAQIVGDGTNGLVDGLGTGGARVNSVLKLTVTPDGQTMYFVDTNRVRRYDFGTGQVDTVINSAGTASFAGNTVSYLASINSGHGVFMNPAGSSLYTTGSHAILQTAVAPPCDCAAQKLHVDYTSDAIPDATAEAISNISLDTATWEVVFEVRNVKAIDNGHVIASAVNTQETAANAFTPLVAGFDANKLWQPEACGLGDIDTPATNLKVRTEWDNASCRTKYEMRYSLIDVNNRDDTYCDLTDDNAGNIKVNCSIVLSSVRAFSSTETWAFTAQEAAFAAELNLGTYLNNEVENLLHATMAKCSVKNGPLYVVDCRVPGVWNFESTFTVAQEPAGWINAASCASNVVGSDAATAATFVRCNIENDAPIANVQRALANITAEKAKTAGQGSGSGSDFLTFDVDFIVPRKVTTTASASLASFVQTIEMKDGKYYYGTADVATLEITVVDTARLSMTALELFNSATPNAQVYDIFPGTSDARFQTALNADATKFTIDFYPAAIREDSAFYRFGPHGINVSFTFSAARRVTGGGTGGQGNVLVEGLNVEGTEATAAQSQGSAASSSSGTALMAGVAVGAAVLVAGLVGAAVVAVKRRGAAASEEKEQL